MPGAVDQLADKQRVHFVRIASDLELPEYVANSDMDVLFRERKKIASIFADVPNMQFPCDDRASTWLSATYYRDKRAEFHEKHRARIEERLLKFAVHWGIRPDINAILCQDDGPTKVAAHLPDSSYLYVWEDDSGKKDRYARMTDALEVKQAAEWLHKYRNHFPWPMRNKMAQMIDDRSRQFGANLGEFTPMIERMLGQGIGDMTKIAGMVRSRENLAANDEMAEVLRKMASEVLALPNAGYHPHMFMELAATMDQVDRSLNLMKKYGSDYRFPEDVIFEHSLSESEGAMARAVPLTNGSIYDRGQLDKVAMSDFTDMFGDELCERMCDSGEISAAKLAEWLPHLPIDQAHMFDRLMRSVGTEPVMKEGQANFTDEQWAELAK